MVKTVFDFEYVKKNNPELKFFDNETIIEKYVENPNFIFNEKLINFDYNFYITHYSDLMHMNYLQACCHYLIHGIEEQRLCGDEEVNKLKEYFDYNFYITHYSDLRHFNYKLAFNHLLDYGLNERRIYNIKLLHVDHLIKDINNKKDYINVTLEYLKNENLYN